MLDRLPIKTHLGDCDTCTICNMPESMRHFFFDYSFPRDIWLLFGLSLIDHVFTFDIITRSIIGLKQDANLFWNILSSYILWFIWKFRNEEKFQGNGRIRTRFLRKLIHFKIISQVWYVMQLERGKLKRFLHNGHASMFIYEMKNGLQRASITDNQGAFDKDLQTLINEIKETRGPYFDQLHLFAHVLERKKVVWMEGDQGWISWIDITKMLFITAVISSFVNLMG